MGGSSTQVLNTAKRHVPEILPQIAQTALSIHSNRLGRREVNKLKKKISKNLRKIVRQARRYELLCVNRLREIEEEERRQRELESKLGTADDVASILAEAARQPEPVPQPSTMNTVDDEEEETEAAEETEDAEGTEEESETSDEEQNDE